MHLVVLSSFFKPLAHEGDMILRLDDQEVDNQRLEDVVHLLLNFLPALFVYIHTHSSLIYN